MKLVEADAAPGVAPHLMTAPREDARPALAPTVAPRRFKAANEGVLRYSEPGGFYQPPCVLELTLDELARKTSGVSWSAVAEMVIANESRGDPVGSDGFGYFARGEYPDSRVKGAVTFLARVRVAWARRRRGFGDGAERNNATHPTPPPKPTPTAHKSKPSPDTSKTRSRRVHNTTDDKAAAGGDSANGTADDSERAARRVHAEREAESVSVFRDPSEGEPSSGGSSGGPSDDEWWRVDSYSWEQYSFKRATCRADDEHDAGLTRDEHDTGLTVSESLEDAMDASLCFNWSDAFKPGILDELEKDRADNAEAEGEIRACCEAFDRYYRDVARRPGVPTVRREDARGDAVANAVAAEGRAQEAGREHDEDERVDREAKRTGA